MFEKKISFNQFKGKKKSRKNRNNFKTARVGQFGRAEIGKRKNTHKTGDSIGQYENQTNFRGGLNILVIGAV